MRCRCCGNNNRELIRNSKFGFQCGECGAGKTDQSRQLLIVCTCGSHTTEYNCECGNNSPPIRVTDQSGRTAVSCSDCNERKVKRKQLKNKRKVARKLVKKEIEDGIEEQRKDYESQTIEISEISEIMNEVEELLDVKLEKKTRQRIRDRYYLT